MAQSPEMTDTQGRSGLGVPLIRFAIRPAPRRYGMATFVTRMGQHLVVYVMILVISIYTCLFVSLPVETSVISVVCIAMGGIAVSLSPTFRRKLQPLLVALAASYIVVAAALLKAFE
jgi:uncharacterized YccA/Bax inhibitor family protein